MSMSHTCEPLSQEVNVGVGRRCFFCWSVKAMTTIEFCEKSTQNQSSALRFGESWVTTLMSRTGSDRING